MYILFYSLRHSSININYNKYVPTINILIQYGPFPTDCHASSDTRAPPFQEREIVVPFTDFPAEIHNEDFHYTHLMAGFVRTSNTSLPLTFNDPHLEPLMFPDIFPDGRGHYYDQCAEVSEDDSIKTETY
jgi:hypothetical protein